MSTHNIAMAVLTSTHNIGFYEDLKTYVVYEDLTKVSVNYHQISSNTHLISSAMI